MWRPGVSLRRWRLFSLYQALLTRGERGEKLPRVWKSVDLHFTRGHLALIAGGPGTGKSAFMLNYALRSGVTCLYFSADSDATVQLARSLAIMTGKNMATATQTVLENNKAVISEALGNVPIRFSFDPSPRLSHIEAETRAYAELYGDYPELIVVDNALDVNIGDDGEDGYQGLDQLMAWLHDLARTTQACVVALHHVTGPFNDSDKPIPLSGVKGQIGRVPELILTLHKQSFEGHNVDSLCVSTVKNRGEKADASGMSFTELDFDGYRMKVSDKELSVWGSAV